LYLFYFKQEGRKNSLKLAGSNLLVMKKNQTKSPNDKLIEHSADLRTFVAEAPKAIRRVLCSNQRQSAT
jgi:hypothetical protein